MLKPRAATAQPACARCVHEAEAERMRATDGRGSTPSRGDGGDAQGIELQPPTVRVDIGLVISLARAVLAVAVLAATIVVPSAASARNEAPHAPRHHHAHVAVIGGQSAEPGTFPWMAYVLDFRGNGVGECSGTVVAPNLILTAGHCAEDMQTGVVNEASGYRVVTGNVNWAAPETDRQVSGVTRVIACPCFDRHTAVGDVALLQLSTPTTAPAVKLASRPPSGTGALLAGWGRTYYNQKIPIERLQWAQTVVQRPEWCEREASPFSPASNVCTIDPPARQTGACNGDSGGPLLVRLGGGPLDVMLSGRGVTHRVVTLQPTGPSPVALFSLPPETEL